MSFTLTDLTYDYNALEPYIDEATIHLHHDKHHQTYLDKFNAIIEKNPILSNFSAEEILAQINSLDVSGTDRLALKNHGGGFVNHNIFWQSMSPQKETDQNLVDQIITKFGSLENFKKQFATTSLSHFGSGWTWLVKKSDGKLAIYSLPNQDSPLTLGDTPIFNLDLWEHSYYLKYQNKRTDYITAWWNILKFF